MLRLCFIILSGFFVVCEAAVLPRQDALNGLENFSLNGSNLGEQTGISFSTTALKSSLAREPSLLPTITTVLRGLPSSDLRTLTRSTSDQHGVFTTGVATSLATPTTTSLDPTSQQTHTSVTTTKELRPIQSTTHSYKVASASTSLEVLTSTNIVTESLRPTEALPTQKTSSSSPLAGVSKTWQIIGTGMIIVTLVGLLILIGTFFDSLWRATKDICCCACCFGTTPDVMENEPPLWDRGAVPEGPAPRQSRLMMERPSSEPSIVALARNRSLKTVPARIYHGYAVSEDFAPIPRGPHVLDDNDMYGSYRHHTHSHNHVSRFG